MAYVCAPPKCDSEGDDTEDEGICDLFRLFCPRTGIAEMYLNCAWGMTSMVRLEWIKHKEKLYIL
jgi:hypothetical protein